METINLINPKTGADVVFAVRPFSAHVYKRTESILRDYQDIDSATDALFETAKSLQRLNAADKNNSLADTIDPKMAQILAFVNADGVDEKEKRSCIRDLVAAGYDADARTANYGKLAELVKLMIDVKKLTTEQLDMINTAEFWDEQPYERVYSYGVFFRKAFQEHIKQN